MVEIIAEVGSVHDGSFGNALKLIDAVAGAGADAVKFQTHIADAETIPGAPPPPYFQDEPRMEYFRRTAFDESQWARLAAHAHEVGLRFISSPFSIEAVELLARVGIDAFKVASGEVTNLPLLDRLASVGAPVLLSSGMSSWAELDVAVATLAPCPLTVFQCSSMYPCPPERAGLNVLSELRERYGCPVGFSDHTEGPWAAVAAVTLGVVAVEKHFTFSRLMYGSDAALATEPADFRAMVGGIRAVGTMLASPVDKSDIGPYAEMKSIYEKSVVLARAVGQGTVLEAADLTTKKPGTGIPAADLANVVGRRVVHDLRADHLLAEDDLA